MEELLEALKRVASHTLNEEDGNSLAAKASAYLEGLEDGATIMARELLKMFAPK